MLKIYKYTERTVSLLHELLGIATNTKPKPWLHLALASHRLGNLAEDAPVEVYWAVFVWDTRDVVEEGHIRTDNKHIYYTIDADDFATLAKDSYAPIKSKQRQLNASIDKYNASTGAMVDRLGEIWSNELRKRYGIKSYSNLRGTIRRSGEARQDIVQLRIQLLEQLDKDLQGSHDSEEDNISLKQCRQSLRYIINELKDAYAHYDEDKALQYIGLTPPSSYA